MFKGCFDNRYEATHEVLGVLYNHYQTKGALELNPKEGAASYMEIVDALRKRNKEYKKSFLSSILDNLSGLRYTKDYPSLSPSMYRRTIMTHEGQMAYMKDEFKIKAENKRQRCRQSAYWTFAVIVGFTMLTITILSLRS